MDTLILSRIQFGANISFHILFPTITIALGWVLLFFKLRFNATGEERWMDAYKFWVKVFALSFAMGVVSGITMSFQFGTNWPGFMETVGNVAGPLLAYEVLTAFFLEAVFLGIMLFGYSRVPGWLHTTATFLVAFGTTMSAFWILVLNSWMHTPAGYELRDGVVHATDWLAIIFNPSMPYRLAHMLIASGLTVSFLIAGVSALRWLVWSDRSDSVRTTLKVGATLGALLIPVQIFIGDQHGLNTLEHQPAKVAAMEAHWDTDETPVPLILFALPDEEARENDFAIKIPYVGSIILTHSLDGAIPGLNDFVAEDGTVLHPPVAPVFFAFRIMVGTGMAMLLLSWSAVWLMRRRAPAKVAAMEAHWDTDETPVPLILFALPDEEARENDFAIKIPYVGSIILTHSLDGAIPGLNDFVAEDGTVLHPPVAPVFFAFRIMVGTGMAMLLLSWSAVWLMRRRAPDGARRGAEGLPKPLLWAFVAMTFSGWLATLAGWYTTEIGRQPWLVQGVLKTYEAVADVPAPMVLSTLIAYLTVYAVLIVAYIGVITYLARKASLEGRPPEPQTGSGGATVQAITPAE